MGKRIMTGIKWGSMLYLFLVVIDLMIELFQIDESGTVITLFGIKIISRITLHELNTTFLLDNRLLLSYAVTISLCLLVGYFWTRRGSKEPLK